MSTDKTIAANTSASSAKMLRAMVGIGILCALLIVLTFEGTKPRIEQLKAEALEQAIFQVLPGIVKTKPFQLKDGNHFTEFNGTDKTKQIVYAGYDKNDSLIGIAVEASGQGYADIIRVLFGYQPETQTIIGFYVLESKETPGLGDRIEKDPAFLSNFNALDVSLTDDNTSVKEQVVTVKHGAKTKPWEVDGITGATISSRAIGNILGTSTKNLIPIIYENRETFRITNPENK